MPEEAPLSAAQRGDEVAFRELVAPHRRELRAYCYRMAGSLDDADDLLQESLLRAWRGLATFEGRSSLRTWLYRVTWSACVDGLEGKAQRMLPIDLGPPSDENEPMPPPRLDGWLGPCPASLYVDDAPSPEARYSGRETVALAFLAALQLLPPKQRALLIARDVVGWSSEECAEWLGTTVSAVNSALQRARETMDAKRGGWSALPVEDETTRALVARYVAAWESADVTALVALLHEDATLSMPPIPLWLRGPRSIGASLRAMVLPPEARGIFRLVPTQANGLPSLATYQKGPDGAFAAASLQLLEIAGSQVRAMTAFLDPTLLARFGLPERL